MKILVTGGRAPFTLHLIRLLYSQGHELVLCESDSINISRFSNKVDYYYRVPKPRQETALFIEKLIEIIQKHSIQLVIPTCEETLYISQHFYEISKYCDVFSGPLDKIHTLHNKNLFYEYLLTRNIDDIIAPHTVLFDDYNQLTDYICKLGKPLVIKPEYSRFGGKTKIIMNPNKQKLNCDISANFRYVVQDYIPGQEICVFLLINHKKITSYSMYRTSITRGKVNIFFDVYQDDYLLELLVKLINDELFNYQGFVSFDIILDNNLYYFIECNPRLSSGIHLFSKEQSLLQKDSLTQGMTKNQALKLLLVFKKPMMIFKSKDVIFDLKDLKPFLLQFILVIAYAFRSFRKRISMSDYTTYDIEFNKENFEQKVL